MKSFFASIGRFFVEAYIRVKSSTPSFMKKIQKASGVVAALHLYFANQPGGAPEYLAWVDSNLSMGIAIAGIVFPQFAGKDSTSEIKEKVADVIAPEPPM